MSVCIDAVNKCRIDDLRTPVFIFEQICSIIYPEEAAMTEFYITLEKDAQQEDFLQGRMLGNPYSSNDPGMGPLMRDVKNKICMDCELIALLEDDSGMELLVNNKIISLDLPVKDVFRKIWCVENNESESMRIVYRMRGLMVTRRRSSSSPSTPKTHRSGSRGRLSPGQQDEHRGRTRSPAAATSNDQRPVARESGMSPAPRRPAQTPFLLRQSEQQSPTTH